MLSRPAVVVMGGAFNPLHAGHVRCVEEAARTAEETLGYSVVAKGIALAPDGYVKQKMARSGGLHLPAVERIAVAATFLEAVGSDIVRPTRCYGSAFEYGKHFVAEVPACHGATILIVQGGDRGAGRWRRPQKPGTATLCLCRGEAQAASLRAERARDEARGLAQPGFHMIAAEGDLQSSTAVRAVMARCGEGCAASACDSGGACAHHNELLEAGIPNQVCVMLLGKREGAL